MHSLTICFGPAATAWMLLFKDEDLAKESYLSTCEAGGMFTCTDDFGQTLAIERKEIRGVMLEDLDLSQEAQVERGLHQARSQAIAQKKAMDDPVIKESIRRQQMGPAVYQPGMPNGPRGMM